MTHVSKKDLDKTIKLKLLDQLFQSFKSAGRNKSGLLLNDLLTPTEKVMFAKRLGMILLIDKGVPQHIISEYLQTSPSTVARISLNIEKGKYKHIVGIIGSQKEHILEKIIKLIFFSMPPRVGRGRWKNVNHLFN